MRIQTTARVQVYDSWIVAYLCKDFGSYYRSLCPKAWHIKPPMYPPHITILRKDIEPFTTRDDLPCSAVIEYEPGIKTDGLYYWLDVYSEEIGDIRESLGLSRYRDGFNCYHVTIGNNK